MKKEVDTLYTLNVEDESEFTDAKMDKLNAQNEELQPRILEILKDMKKSWSRPP